MFSIRKWNFPRLKLLGLVSVKFKENFYCNLYLVLCILRRLSVTCSV